MRFIDTNILLRHLTQDHAAKGQACSALLVEIGQGEVQAWTTDLVVAEMVFVLGSKGPNGYNFTREQVRQGLLPLLSLPGLHLPTKTLYPRIFDLYVTYDMDFIDAYHAALIEVSAVPELYSYDTDFDLVSEIRRFEPIESVV